LLDLPDEVIQYILRLLPPYNDLKTCMQVCKRLHTNVQSKLSWNLEAKCLFFIQNFFFTQVQKLINMNGTRFENLITIEKLGYESR
jgi:F-box domain.